MHELVVAAGRIPVENRFGESLAGSAGYPDEAIQKLLNDTVETGRELKVTLNTSQKADDWNSSVGRHRDYLVSTPGSQLIAFHSSSPNSPVWFVVLNPTRLRGKVEGGLVFYAPNLNQSVPLRFVSSGCPWLRSCG